MWSHFVPFYTMYGCNLCGHFDYSISRLWTINVNFHVWADTQGGGAYVLGVIHFPNFILLIVAVQTFFYAFWSLAWKFLHLCPIHSIKEHHLIRSTVPLLPYNTFSDQSMFTLQCHVPPIFTILPLCLVFTLLMLSSGIEPATFALTMTNACLTNFVTCRHI